MRIPTQKLLLGLRVAWSCRNKPFKYVPMFSYVEAVAITKSNLMDAVGYDKNNFMKGLRTVSEADVFEIRCKTGHDVDKITFQLNNCHCFSIVDYASRLFNGVKV